MIRPAVVANQPSWRMPWRSLSAPDTPCVDSSRPSHRSSCSTSGKAGRALGLVTSMVVSWGVAHGRAV